MMIGAYLKNRICLSFLNIINLSTLRPQLDFNSRVRHCKISFEEDITREAKTTREPARGDFPDIGIGSC